MAHHHDPHEAAIKDKIQKLLSYATDRQGEPEAANYLSKAFELMARYGVEQKDLNRDEPGTIVEKNFELSGAYTDSQANLLISIADALHCATVITAKRSAMTVGRIWVAGARHHLERVEILFHLLNPHMLAGATASYKEWKATQDAREKLADELRESAWGNLGIGFAQPAPRPSATVMKRSWMEGFITEIWHRLQEAEGDHAGEYARDGKEGALVLVGDQQRAEDFRDHTFPDLHRPRARARRRQLHQDSMNEGLAAGRNVDLGQTRVQNKRALES